MYEIDSSLINAPLHKQIDGPWIGLLALAIFMFITALIAILVLCFFWRRYRQRTRFSNQNYILNDKSTVNNRPIPVQIENHQPPQSYETQQMDVFVPQGEEQNLGEIHTRFRPEEGIQEMHEVYQRTTKAYF